MAWLEQCEVCGGGGFFCCHRSSRHADLNQVAGAAGGPSGFVQEFQFFGRPDEEGMAWLLGGDVDAAGDGEGVAPEDRGTPPVAPAPWDLDGRWPALDDGGCSVSACPKAAPLAEAGVAGSAPYSAGAAAVPYFFGGGADDLHRDTTEAADKATASSSGKDDGGGMDREARVLRYREKKKRRKFGKQIRYASRKAYAEARPRIRGRFVKAPDADVGVPPSSSQPPLPTPSSISEWDFSGPSGPDAGAFRQLPPSPVPKASWRCMGWNDR